MRGLFFSSPVPESLIVTEAATACGVETVDRVGIVSKRAGSRYIAGRTDHWRKVKDPAAPAVTRELEEE